ncbi:MAG: UDP-3-O-acyl-N-acetylglucosamine deacetylase, partial [Longimicrobiales bacterium]|nr:UDP-3-O-acyl-N-acetylglucosamine deacetylase [Longimicrobiales bacterium]
MSDRQRTLAASISVSGTGVHSGRPVTLRLLPAEANTGLRFRRTDLSGSPEIPVGLDAVVDTRLGTSLGLGEARVDTVEHLLAALAARHVDNAILELDAPEPPIRDGSSA